MIYLFYHINKYSEKDKWDQFQYLKVAKVTGSEKKRIAALGEEADIYIINRENVPWLVDYLGFNWRFDMVVIDEDVMKVLQKKEASQNDLLEAVKARLKKEHSWRVKEGEIRNTSELAPSLNFVNST